MWIHKDYLPDWDWIRADDVVIDIGAYIGAFSVLAAWLAPKGKVYAFEPDRENFEFVNQNTRANRLHNLFPYNLAVAGHRGERPFMGSSTMGSLYEGWYELMSGRTPGPAAARVRCTTLEEIFIRHGLERVRFLKSDCEGAEFEIFRDTSLDYLGRIDRIGMEYHLARRDFSLAGLRNALESAGFEVRAIERGRFGMLYARHRSVTPPATSGESYSG